MRSNVLPRTRLGDWRGVVLLAATYVYFLIFAQFGFLQRLAELGIAGSHLNVIMAAMAIGGIGASLGAPRLRIADDPVLRLRVALGGCIGAALLTVAPLAVAAAVAVAALIGLSLGLLTVTLVANLALCIGPGHPLSSIGLGTGLGYLLCNVPALFTATPRTIACAAALACVAGLFASSTDKMKAADPGPDHPSAQTPFPLVLAWFTGLIWLDSAAFFIIQNSPALRAGTWHGAGHLWTIGALHLLAALVSAFLLARRGLAPTLLCAFAALAAACLLLLRPANAPLATFLYPVGVSLYSVALVAAPSFLLASASARSRAYKAGWLYAIAGWTGSALGIGMGQHLHRVPPAFILFAGLLFLAPALARLPRQLALPGLAVVLSLAAAVLLQRLLPQAQTSQSTVQDQVARGRQVYIAEGCIHCHSQYVRPHSPDVLMWGPAQDVEEVRRQRPPLIGNRRQGPDLSEAGSRRSALWLRIHFFNPRDVSYHSVMPSYRYLFDDERGADLIAYIQSLKTPPNEEPSSQVAQWTPARPASTQDERVDGQQLFSNYCATCHVDGGRARSQWRGSFRRLPPNLSTGPLLDLPASEAPAASELHLARIIKFGIPGTDMPGHI